MPDELSVRQWQEQFRAGAFDSKDTAVQREAGWWDWHCREDAVAGRLKRIAPVVTGIKAPSLLDNYTVWFTNVRSTGRKAVYDRVQFEPLGGKCDGRIFRVDFGNPNEPEKWTLYTERFGFGAPEYGCAHVREMIEYIHTMAHELEQGIRPPFLDEKAAAVEYILHRPVLYPSRALRREGEHSYSFLDRDDGSRKMVHIAHSLKDVPLEFTSGVRKSGGLYVYCPEDAGSPLPTQQDPPKKSQKRKEPER